MGHHDQDPGHGEPGHVHDEQWNRHMMETDDPAVDQSRVNRTPDPTTPDDDRSEDQSNRPSDSVLTDR